jgi:hypothetical protein
VEDSWTDSALNFSRRLVGLLVAEYGERINPCRAHCRNNAGSKGNDNEQHSDSRERDNPVRASKRNTLADVRQPNIGVEKSRRVPVGPFDRFT